MKNQSRLLLLCALLVVLVSPTACKKSDSTASKVTTISDARQISGAHHWRGVSRKGYNDCAGTNTTPNDTDFSVTYLNDSTLSVWGGPLNLMSNGYFVTAYPIINLRKRNDSVFFTYQTNFLACYYITTYYDTL